MTDLDLVTISSALVGSLEYYSMLTVVHGVLAELNARELWSAVAERKAYLATLHFPHLDGEAALAEAQVLDSRDKNEHFPVLYRDEDADPAAWNGYLDFGRRT